MWLRNDRSIGAASVDYLFYSGYVALAFWWAKSVAAADRGSHPEAFVKAKRDTARFFYSRLLPRCLAHAAAIRAGAASVMALDEESFAS